MPFESDVMVTLDHLPVSFAPIYSVAGFPFDGLTTTLAGFIPSRKMVSVDPITLLRG